MIRRFVGRDGVWYAEQNSAGLSRHAKISWTESGEAESFPLVRKELRGPNSHRPDKREIVASCDEKQGIVVF